MLHNLPSIPRSPKPPGTKIPWTLVSSFLISLFLRRSELIQLMLTEDSLDSPP